MDRVTKGFRRQVHGILTSSEKRDELLAVQPIDAKNTRVIQAVKSYSKNIGSCIRTAGREDPDKRRKKVDEYQLGQELLNETKALEEAGAHCLASVTRKIAEAVNALVEEKVNTEIALEKEVLEKLAKFVELEKAVVKSKDKLKDAITDYDMAKRTAEKKEEKGVGYEQSQEEVDTKHLKLESTKDNTITEIYSLASREREIAEIFMTYVEEQAEFHRAAMAQFQNVLPEIRKAIDYTPTQPVFGMDLSKHLRISRRKISVVIEKCVELIRRHGYDERGLFRVNGNNNKIRRLKAAFDAGQVDDDSDSFARDPHSVCSVLKSYLRELPDPLLGNNLHTEWISAVRYEGNERVAEVQRVLNHLPPANYDNLKYLVGFLLELLRFEKQNMMNASNLAIVIGPNLIGCSGEGETDNITGSKVLETILLNADRLFPDNNHVGTGGRGNNTPSPAASSRDSPPNYSSQGSRDRLTVDTVQSRNRNDAISPASIASISSPSPSNSRRPKQPAPPPPPTGPYATKNEVVVDNLIDLSQSHGSFENLTEELSKSPSVGSNDSMSEYANEHDIMSKPPPPVLRQQSNTPSMSGARPQSYMVAQTHEMPTPKEREKVRTESVRASFPAPEPRNRASQSADEDNRTVVSVDPPNQNRAARPPLPTKPAKEEITKL